MNRRGFSYAPPLGNISSTPAALPEVLKAALEGRLARPATLNSALRKRIRKLGLSETTHFGGSLDKPLSKAGRKPALYFVIHDTSSPTLSAGSQFPADINQPSWPHNNLDREVNVTDPVAHMFVNRVGESRTGHDFGSAKHATKLETSRGLGSALVGRFLHTEMVQPRINNAHGVDEFAPQPGFSGPQMDRLALLYACASARGGEWLIPAFHCVLDEGIRNGHDDPQNFSLDDWGRALAGLLADLDEGLVEAEVSAEPGGPALLPHPAFRDLAALYSSADLAFPQLKAVTLAHWALASNWGNSTLAINLRNFANLPYREEMADVAESVFYVTEGGESRQWCSFNSARSFIQGYWRWLQREHYSGWQARVRNPNVFIKFVGKVYSGVDSYSDRVLALLPQAQELLDHAADETLHISHTVGGIAASDFLTVTPASALTTIDGYTPPTASLDLLKGVPMQLAERVGQKYSDRFARWDKSSRGKTDPSLCRGLYRLPTRVLFWESKMAVDADGATTPSVLANSSGSQVKTSLLFKNGTPVNAEVVPYFVAPSFDDPRRVKRGAPWEGSGDRFVSDFGLKPGNLGVVIFRDKITGAIFADEGPAMKIGEASIRVHELIRKPGAPWKGNPANKVLLDASEEKGVLYFVFLDGQFDINSFGPNKQAQMAAAIQEAAIERYRRLRQNSSS